MRDFVREGEVGREHAEEWVEEIMTRSRRNAEQLTELVTGEVRRQVEALGLMRIDDAPRLFEQLAEPSPLDGGAGRARRRGAGRACAPYRRPRGA